mmetsp:Transcript_52075/g.82801  ORF Transcript_52075/g.82801 Transcript_52075/m.82801 type:complete len:404 (+) Transcript_52075:51-1262(+)
MALGTPSRASGSGTPLSHAMNMVPGSPASSMVMAQPISAHVGAYGGSFASPMTRASGSSIITSAAPQQPGTPNSSRALLAVPQSALVPPLRGQSSSANLIVPPPAQVVTSILPRSSTSAVPLAYPTAFASAPLVSLEGHVVDGALSEEVLLRTRLVGSSDELVKAETESLRRSMAAQEDRIMQLTKDLQESNENARKIGVELEASRDEAMRCAEELRLERAARELAEAQLLEARMAAEVQRAANRENVGGSNGRRTPTGRGSPQRGASASRRALAERNSPQRGRDPSLDERWPTSTKPNSPIADNASNYRNSRPHAAKDEIDGRLFDFLDRADHDLLFRRLNRGWYSFRNKGDRGPLSNDRSVEISIVNGKLMAKLEPSTHDPGWNNGKVGTIERFVAAMSQI